jgi:hypothetical protein
MLVMLAVRWATTGDPLDLLFPLLVPFSVPLFVLWSALQRFDNPTRQRLGLGEGVVAHLDHHSFGLSHPRFDSLSTDPTADLH